MALKIVPAKEPEQLETLFIELRDWAFQEELRKLNLTEVYRKFRVDIENDSVNKFLFDVLIKTRNFVEMTDEPGLPTRDVTVDHSVVTWCRYSGDGFAKKRDNYIRLLSSHPHLGYVDHRQSRIVLHASDFENTFWKMNEIDDIHVRYRRMLYVFNKYMEYDRHCLYDSVKLLKEEIGRLENEMRQEKEKSSLLEAKLQEITSVDVNACIADMHIHG